MTKPFDENKAVADLAKEIDKIDFDGGLTTSPIPAPEYEKPAAEPEPIPESEPKPAEEPQPESEPAAEGEPIPESKEAEPAAETTPSIPDSHYRAAINVLGLPPAEASAKISALYDKDPELARQWLEGCYRQVNESSKQFAELGRQSRQMRETPAAPVAPQPSRKEAVLARLKEKYQDDPVIDILGELIPDTAPTPEIREVRSQPAQQTSDPQVEIERQMAVRTEINNFFGDSDMEVFADFYGKPTSLTGNWAESLTPGQRANRREVCDRAQMILDGADRIGTQMSAAEALERAHLEVAAPMTEQIVRERIVKSVQKRAAGVTLKPSGTKPSASTAYNKDTAVKEMEQAIKEVFKA